MQSGRSMEAGSDGSGGASEVAPTLRLAVISSPRSGNTWLRQMIAALYGLEQIPVHFPEDIPWESLPNRCIVQIHWNPEPEFNALLERAGFRVVAIGRHLFDSLMSYLNYVYYVHQDGICAGGGACPECAIVGQTPQSRQFRDYVASDRAALLFGYTRQWWDRPGVIRFRYEDLIADPAIHLRNLVEVLGEPPVRSIAEVIEETSMDQAKPSRDVWQYHFWQGRPGLWRSMIPGDEAVWLAEHHREFFDILGYPVDPDPALDPMQAELNWIQLQLNSTRAHLALERTKHRMQITEAKGLRHQIHLSERAAADQDAAYREAHTELLRYRDAYLDTRDQLIGKQRMLDATIQRLDAIYQAHETTHQRLDDTYLELQSTREEVQSANHDHQATQEELQAMSHALSETRQRLEETQQQLAPLAELGPRGVKWALRAMRLYRKAKARAGLPLPDPAPTASAHAPAPKLFRHPRNESGSPRVES